MKSRNCLAQNLSQWYPIEGLVDIYKLFVVTTWIFIEILTFSVKDFMLSSAIIKISMSDHLITSESLTNLYAWKIYLVSDIHV